MIVSCLVSDKMSDENQKPFTPLPIASNLTDWANEPTLISLKADFDIAKQTHDAHVVKIDKWNDLIKITGKAKPVKVKGHSSIQPKLIRRQAEWRYSALTEPFLSTDKLYKVTPNTFEDTDGARQNELVLNWQFNTKLNKVKFIDDYVRSAVDDGTCIVRLGWNRIVKEEKVTKPVFQYLPIEDEENMAVLQQALEMQSENPRMYLEQASEELKASVDYYMETGVPAHAIPTSYQEVVQEKIIKNTPTVDILNPRNVYIDPSCEGDFDKALFIVISFETNKAELLREPDRYKNLDSVLWDSNDPTATPDHYTNTPSNANFNDSARKKVVAYEYWGWYDIHGTGELVPIVATWIGNTFIRMELNPFPDEKLPFVLVNYMPVKRELYGETDAELLEENQQIMGAVTRGMIDLLGRSANGQQGFAKGMLDPLNRRKFDSGSDYEFNPTQNPMNGGIIEHKYPEIPNSALSLLGIQNQEAEGLTGVKAFSGGISGQGYGDVAAGIRGALDAASKREMAILRRLSKGIADIGSKIIAMNAEFLSDVEVVRVTNEEFVYVNREDLKGQFDLIVDISTAEVDTQKSQDLGFMLQTIGPKIDPLITSRILSEIAALKRMPQLAHDLKKWKPQPDPVAEQIKQMELQKLQLELAEIQSRIELNKARAAKESAEGDQKNLDFVEQENGTKHARAMEVMKGQAEGNAQLEVTKALLRPRKPEDSKPDVEAAIGYNQISDRGNDAPTPMSMWGRMPYSPNFKGV